MLARAAAVVARRRGSWMRVLAALVRGGAGVRGVS